LTVTEKKIFTDQNAENGIDFVAGFHIIGAFMVGTLIGNPQVV
jgi:hypothetical protein